MPEDVRKKLGKDAVVHILLYGQTICGQAGLPKDWPENHWWTNPSEKDLATCKVCLEGCSEDLSDTDAPVAAAERFLYRKQPDPEPELDKEVEEELVEPAEPEFKPDSDEHGIYIAWAKRVAQTFSVRVWVVDFRASSAVGRYQCAYGIQFNNDPHRTRIQISPDGTILECEVLT